MSSIYKLPKLQEDSLMSSVDEVDSRHNRDLNDTFAVGSALKIRTSINDKNRKDFKKHKLVSPLAFSSRLLRTEKKLEIGNP